MIGYVSVEEQVDKDFQRALLKASLHRWKERLLNDSPHDCLLSFDEVKSGLARCSQAYRGMQFIEVEKVAGSVGRYRDFDGSFLPLKQSMGYRWSRIDRAYLRGENLPPVSLYKIGDTYFVRDGNHRVSVARYHGVEWIDAEVVELRGHPRTEATQRTERAPDSLIRRPQHPRDPDTSSPGNIWQRLRPGLWRPGTEHAA